MDKIRRRAGTQNNMRGELTMEPEVINCGNKPKKEPKEDLSAIRTERGQKGEPHQKGNRKPERDKSPKGSQSHPQKAITSVRQP